MQTRLIRIKYDLEEQGHSPTKSFCLVECAFSCCRCGVCWIASFALCDAEAVVGDGGYQFGDCPRQQMSWPYFAQPVSTQLWRIQSIQKGDQCSPLVWRQTCPTLAETNPKILVLLHDVAGLVVADC